MAEIPARYLTHTVNVDPYLGSTGRGETYATTITNIACARDDTRKLVRSSDNTEVVSETTLIMRLAHTGSFPVESKVDLGDRTATVITANPRTDIGVGAWGHLEVTLT